MVYAYIQDVPIGGRALPPDHRQDRARTDAGSLLHLCVRQPDGRLRYLDVWESEQACGQAFEQRIHPAVDAAFGGQRPAAEPQVHRLELLHATGSWLADRP